MELLGLLEKRMDSLIAELSFLRQENVKLRQEKAVGHTHLTQDNKRLKQALKEEQQAKDVFEKRVEVLLSRLDGLASDKR